jgi:hypothetical protein
MKTKHDHATPRPWRIGEPSQYGRYIVTDGDDPITVAETSPDYNQDFDATAALIVEAVNQAGAVEALLRAAKRQSQTLESLNAAMMDTSGKGFKFIGDGEYRVHRSTLAKLHQEIILATNELRAALAAMNR